MNDDLEDIVFEESNVQAIFRTAAGYGLHGVDKPVVSEISLKIYVNGQEMASLLCLNQQHIELALGFLYNEGVINNYDEVKAASYNPAAHVVHIELSDSVTISRQESLRSVTAGCGKCFTYINPLRKSQFRQIDCRRRFPLAQIMRRMADFTQKSGLYKGMGGVHSLLLHAPECAVFAEDIGRHNCLDKVTGDMLKTGRLSAAGEAVVYISGRVTSEIMTKLIRLGAPVIVSKSTPSVAAIKLAEQYGVTLLGYVKNDGGFVYSGADRLIIDESEPGSAQDVAATASKLSRGKAAARRVTTAGVALAMVLAMAAGVSACDDDVAGSGQEATTEAEAVAIDVDAAGGAAATGDDGSNLMAGESSLTGQNRERPTATDGIDAGTGVGDSVCLGPVTFESYWGASISQNYAWRVLAIEDGKALLITEDIIELRPYNPNNTQAAWQQSAMREWLNGDFYHGLPEDVQQITMPVDTGLPGAAGYETTGDSEWTDKVSLLSVEEAEIYFQSDADRQAVTDVPETVIDAVEEAYRLGHGHIRSFEQEFGGWSWWLRTPDISAGVAAVVSIDGKPSYIGGVHEWGPTQVPDYSGARPVIQVRLP